MREIVVTACQGDRLAKITFDDGFDAYVPMRVLPSWTCKMLMLTGNAVGIDDYPTEIDKETKKEEILKCIKHHYEEVFCRAGEVLQS